MPGLRASAGLFSDPCKELLSFFKTIGSHMRGMHMASFSVF